MIVIDYQDRRPLYEQVTEKLKLLILKGALKPDEQLPSVRNLSMELSVNPSTIQKAYAALEREGYIYPIKGRGNFVCPDLDAARREKDALLEDFASLIQKAKAAGIPQEDLSLLLQRAYEDGTEKEKEEASETKVEDGNERKDGKGGKSHD